ncbi:MAG: hypothetical protein FWE04_00900 [Oscillospiraceae bacterium]|nr:hypothetical protein [Oscillospiraceae bacterium]
MKNVKKLVALLVIFVMIFAVWGTVQLFAARGTPQEVDSDTLNISYGEIADTLGMEATTTTISSNVTVNMALLYNNIYHEGILIPGETMRVETNVSNTNPTSISARPIIAKFNNGRFVDYTILSQQGIAANQNIDINFDVPIPSSGVDEMRIMLWTNFALMRPLHVGATLTTGNGTDFFGNTPETAQQINISRSVNGRIRIANRGDYFRFTVPTEQGGLYRISTTGAGLTRQLFAADGVTPIQPLRNELNQDVLVHLQGGQAFVLRISGTANTPYAINLERAEVSTIHTFNNLAVGDFIDVPVNVPSMGSLSATFSVEFDSADFEVISAYRNAADVHDNVEITSNGVFFESTRTVPTGQTWAGTVNTVRLRAKRAGNLNVTTNIR